LAYLEATAKAKYRGLSTAAAKAPPSVEMTCFLGRFGKTGDGKGKCKCDGKGKGKGKGKENRQPDDGCLFSCWVLKVV
jgi:hypothetical protein